MPGKYTYGPVPSRRLGFSLGIDLIPFKNCSFDCIYCQLGKTTNKTIERKEYFRYEEILREVKDTIEKGGRIDYLTFSGSGEPTLHSRLGHLINELKKITKIPIAVLTNGTLLFMPDVQQDLLEADVVLPTLCTTTQKIFQKINRPYSTLNIEKIIQGQIGFRKKYKGKIWLEIMLVKGINDAQAEINKLNEVVKEIAPDKIHLNTVVRPPSEKYASPLSIEELQRIKNVFGSKCEVIAGFKDKREALYPQDIEKTIMELTKRRPVTLEDISNVTGLHKNEIIKYIDHLQQEKKIALTEHGGQNYYEAIG